MICSGSKKMFYGERNPQIIKEYLTVSRARDVLSV